MSSLAVHAFEAALNRAAPHTSAVQPTSRAAASFDLLLKARAPKAPKASANAPAEQLGRGGSGRTEPSLEGMAPHLVHGGEYKVVTYPGQKKSTTIGPSHSDWGHADFAKHEVHKGDNPWEPLSRLGHAMEQHIQTLPPEDRKIALTDYEHPSHPFHLAYVSKLIKQTLDPSSPHFAKHKASGTLGNLQQQVPSARWSVSNQDAASTQLPKNHHEDVGRLKTASSDSAATFAAGNVGRSVRAKATIASLNRYMDVARKHGIGPDTDPAEFTARAHALPLNRYSARRAPEGFLPEHLSGKHDPTIKGDIHARGKKKGQPTHTPSAEFAIPAGEKSHWEDTLGAEGAAKLNNHHDLIEHYKTLPVGSGNDAKFKGKVPGIHYLPSRAKAHLDAHDRMFGVTKPAPGTP